LIAAVVEFDVAVKLCEKRDGEEVWFISDEPLYIVAELTIRKILIAVGHQNLLFKNSIKT
jgi:hypothetical protein